MSVKDDIDWTLNPNHYTTYEKDKIHYWKFRVIPSLVKNNPKEYLDNLYYNITNNEYILQINGDYTDLSTNFNNFSLVH